MTGATTNSKKLTLKIENELQRQHRLQKLKKSNVDQINSRKENKSTLKYELPSVTGFEKSRIETI